LNIESKWDQSNAERWWLVHRPEATGRRPAIHIEEAGLEVA